MTPTDFVAALRTYRGVRFWHLGRSRTGVDCAGLVVCAVRDCGETMFDRKDYQSQVATAVLRHGLLASFKEVSIDFATTGDILLFCSRDGNPQHVAVLTGPNTIIHAWDAVGEVREHPLTSAFRPIAAFRWREW